jgi:DNA-binding MarR family transcriptional regulator
MSLRQSVVNHAIFNFSFHTSEIRVVAALVKAANDLGEAVLTVKELAKETHLGVRTVATALDSLEEAGYFERLKTAHQPGTLPTNVYKLRRQPAPVL